MFVCAYCTYGEYLASGKSDSHMWRGQRQGAWGVQRKTCDLVLGERCSKGFLEVTSKLRVPKGKSRSENVPDGWNSKCKDC